MLISNKSEYVIKTEKRNQKQTTRGTDQSRMGLDTLFVSRRLAMVSNWPLSIGYFHRWEALNVIL